MHDLDRVQCTRSTRLELGCAPRCRLLSRHCAGRTAPRYADQHTYSRIIHGLDIAARTTVRNSSYLGASSPLGYDPSKPQLHQSHEANASERRSSAIYVITVGFSRPVNSFNLDTFSAVWMIGPSASWASLP